MTMKVPVLPIPAEQWTTIGPAPSVGEKYKDKVDCAIMTFKDSDCDLQKLIGFYIDNVLPLSE